MAGGREALETSEMAKAGGVVEWAKHHFPPHSLSYRVLQYLYQRRFVLPSLIQRGARIHAYLARHSCRKICVGAGPSKLPGWLMTDYLPQDSSVIFLDARRRFPFPARSIDYYFTEHMIEHVDYVAGRHALQQMFLTLKPGGCIRIATPDLQKVLALNAAPVDADSVESRYIRSLRPPAVRISRDRPSFAINNLISGSGHRFVYDADTLQDSLAEVGFIDIRRRKIGESDDPILQNLETHGDIIGRDFNDLETMVIEARKPPFAG